MSDFLMSLKDANIAFGRANVLENVTLSISKGLRAALTGRNGEGKSTFLKVLAGLVELDSGEVVRANGLSVRYVDQSVPADREGDSAFNALSGGMRRRKMLEEALLARPDLLLLDEPTNHLDVAAIDWLEGCIRRSREMSVIIVTHDRRFLRRVATRIYDLDRGELSGWDCDYQTFVKRKAELMADEAVYWERKSKKLAQEEAWVRRGVKARTTRNEGRVAALMELRKEFASRRRESGKARISLDTASPGGVCVIKLKDVSFSWGDKAIIKNFTGNILRGERIGIIGPNGVGKTTLLNILTGRLRPDSGEVTLGTNVQMAFFSQLRSEMNPELTVAENLAPDRDEVVVGGVRKHVYSYLADFLFPPERARTPLKALSGGERARLMLVRLFLQPANLLVMDEPTNDLDIETLELLEEQLLAYKGTLLLVTHDREFLDNVVTSTLVLEGDGNVAQYPGGWEDYEAQRPKPAEPANMTHETKSSQTAGAVAPAKSAKLTFNEKRELESITIRISQLEAEIASAREELCDPGIYRRDAARASSLAERLPKAEAELDQALERWTELEERNT